MVNYIKGHPSHYLLSSLNKKNDGHPTPTMSLTKTEEKKQGRKAKNWVITAFFVIALRHPPNE